MLCFFTSKWTKMRLVSGLRKDPGREKVEPFIAKYCVRLLLLLVIFKSYTEYMMDRKDKQIKTQKYHKTHLK